jgi:hypothetical protein
MNSPTERVVGIGGLFFRSREPPQLPQWYQLHPENDLVPIDGALCSVFSLLNVYHLIVTPYY